MIRPVPTWTDQVPRLEAFKVAHPDVEIHPPPAGSPWWKTYRDGEQLAVQHDLKRLLDSLDAKLDMEGPGQ